MVLPTVLPVAYASAIDLHAMGKLHLSSHAACPSTWVVALPTWGLHAELYRWFGRPDRAMLATPRGQMVPLTMLPVAYASAIDRHAMGKLHLSSHAACPSTWVNHHGTCTLVWQPGKGWVRSDGFVQVNRLDGSSHVVPRGCASPWIVARVQYWPPPTSPTTAAS